MADTIPKLTKRQTQAVVKQALGDLSELPATLEGVADVVAVTAEVLRAGNEERRRELEQRSELLKLEQDAAIVCEMFARQSRYLAKTILRTEQRSGVALSPTDLLAGIINGIEESGMDLTHCGTREDVSSIVKQFINLAQKEIRSWDDE